MSRGSAAGRLGCRQARRGRGIAFARYKNIAAYAAVVAEVEVEEGPSCAWCAADAGLVINPMVPSTSSKVASSTRRAGH
jgi:CO/xanthine dehydrogenase Mo-binding subunit